MAPAEAENYKQVAESVMRECIINLARIKETVSQAIADRAPSQGLDSVPSLVRGIKAGLLMLNKTRALDVVDDAGRRLLVQEREVIHRHGPRRERDQHDPRDHHHGQGSPSCQCCSTPTSTSPAPPVRR